MGSHRKPVETVGEGGVFQGKSEAEIRLGYSRGHWALAGLPPLGFSSETPIDM